MATTATARVTAPVMGPDDERTAWLLLAPVLAFVLALPFASRPASAAKWDVTPGLVVEETYSDNIALSPPGTERGDFVTSISPRITVKAVGDRGHFDAEYRPELLWWANQGATRALHFYDVNGTAELLKGTL